MKTWLGKDGEQGWELKITNIIEEIRVYNHGKGKS